MPSSGTLRDDPEYTGSVAAGGLTNLVRLNGVNGFTGAISVAHEGGTGALHFRDGQVVHAETATAAGEAAFFEILEWPSVRYAVDDDAPAVRPTIRRGLKLLLMELERPARERTVEIAPAAPPAADGRRPPPVRRERLAAVVEEIRRIPGVACATLHLLDGAAAAAPSSPLERDAAVLGRLGRRLGELLGTGDLTAGSVHGSERNLLLVGTREFQITIVTPAGEGTEAVNQRIRKLFAAR